MTVDVAAIREAAGIAVEEGPRDKEILAAAKGFIDQFHFWYSDVMSNAVANYRTLIIKRINPFIRRLELGDATPLSLATRLVDDYANRNFVTAGGWSIEKMAIGICKGSQKSTAIGIDFELHDPDKDSVKLYVVKSGSVTRNSDILSKLKENARKAGKLHRQGGNRETNVQAFYAVAAGKTSSTDEDGILRPSSAQLWADLTGLPAVRAVRLMIEIARHAGLEVQRDAAANINAMIVLVATYVAQPANPAKTDWDFLGSRTTQERKEWDAEDKRRHGQALKALADAGLVVPKRIPRAKGPAARKGAPRSKHVR